MHSDDCSRYRTKSSKERLVRSIEVTPRRSMETSLHGSPERSEYYCLKTSQRRTGTVKPTPWGVTYSRQAIAYATSSYQMLS